MAGYLVLDGKRGQEYWITFRFGEGWVLAYRVTFPDDESSRRRVRIQEVRIVPGIRQHDMFSPTRNYILYEARATAAGRPLPTFSFDAVRRTLTARRFAHGFASAVAGIPTDEIDEWGSPPSEVGTSPARTVGRPGKSRAFYATFALRFDRVENRRTAGTSTRAVLARRYNVPITTIGRWIRVARQFGFLGRAVRPGGRGGEATDLARKFAQRGTTR